jgi:hypothetical protein
MCFEVLRFGSKLAVGSGEQQIVGDQRVERRDVRLELSDAHSRLELDHLLIWRPNEYGGHARSVEVMHVHRDLT